VRLAFLSKRDYPSTNGHFQTERAMMVAIYRLSRGRLPGELGGGLVGGGFFLPWAETPHGDVHCLPPWVRPPAGWSTGFIEEAAIVRRSPEPALGGRTGLESVMFMLVGVRDTAPMVPMQRPVTSAARSS